MCEIKICFSAVLMEIQKKYSHTIYENKKYNVDFIILIMTVQFTFDVNIWLLVYFS